MSFSYCFRYFYFISSSFFQIIFCCYFFIRIFSHFFIFIIIFCPIIAIVFINIFILRKFCIFYYYFAINLSYFCDIYKFFSLKKVLRLFFNSQNFFRIFLVKLLIFPLLANNFLLLLIQLEIFQQFYNKKLSLHPLLHSLVSQLHNNENFLIMFVT